MGKMIKEKSVRRINRFIPIWKDYMGMLCFIKTEGLYDKFLGFYVNFNLEQIDDYKQKKREKSIKD